MAWVAEYHLAAAVSNAGGLGLIGAASAPAQWVREQIQEAKKLTDKPFGVNIMLMSPYADDVAKVVVEEGVKVVDYRRRKSGEVYENVEGSRGEGHPRGSVGCPCKADGALRCRCPGGRRHGGGRAISARTRLWYWFPRWQMQLASRSLQAGGMQTAEE